MPIVFVQVLSDPVGALASLRSLARPGGNATGFTVFETAYRCEMAGAAQGDRAPVKRVAVLRDPPATGRVAANGEQFSRLAPSFGVELSAVNMRVETGEYRTRRSRFSCRAQPNGSLNSDSERRRCSLVATGSSRDGCSAQLFSLGVFRGQDFEGRSRRPTSRSSEP